MRCLPHPACGSFYRGSGLDTAAEEMRRMYAKRRTPPLLLGFGFLLSPCLTYGQGAVTPFEKLPDWSGLWSMMGGTVFDTSTQTGKGGVVSISTTPYLGSLGLTL